MWGWAGLYGRPPWVTRWRWLIDERLAQPHPTGDHKGTHPIHTTALAPTESSIELRLMFN
jgi:hypothetical protein